jgi:hypothetical protein
MKKIVESRCRVHSDASTLVLQTLSSVYVIGHQYNTRMRYFSLDATSVLFAILSWMLHRIP